jgi:hypothetical protein
MLSHVKSRHDPTCIEPSFFVLVTISTRKAIQNFLAIETRTTINHYLLSIPEENFVHDNNDFLRDILPAELGGSAPPYNNASWAQQLIGDDTSFAFSDKHIFWPKDGGVSPGIISPWLNWNGD